MSQLRMLTQELTEVHLTNHQGRIGKAQPLITELRQAITHSTSGGGDKADGRPLPLDAAALELLQSIERMAAEDHHNRYGERYFGTIEGLIQKIGTDNHEPQWQTWFERIYTEWRDQINNTIRPTKMRRLDGTPCPACSMATHGPERETTMVIDCYYSGTKELRPIQTWEAHCRGCGADWQKDTMKWLIAYLAA